MENEIEYITEKKVLSEHLKGFANSLDNGWMDEQAVYGALLIILESANYLKEEKKYYVKNL